MEQDNSQTSKIIICKKVMKIFHRIVRLFFCCSPLRSSEEPIQALTITTTEEALTSLNRSLEHTKSSIGNLNTKISTTANKADCIERDLSDLNTEMADDAKEYCDKVERKNER